MWNATNFFIWTTYFTVFVGASTVRAHVNLIMKVCEKIYVALLTYLITYLLTYLLTYSMQQNPSWEANRTYGIILWGCASKSNIAIMQRYQSKILRLITNAPWYVNKQTRHTDLQIPFVHTVLQDHIRKHRNTLESHPNPLVERLLYSENNRRLKRRWTFDATNWGNAGGRSPWSLTQLPAH